MLYFGLYLCFEMCVLPNINRFLHKYILPKYGEILTHVELFDRTIFYVDFSGLSSQCLEKNKCNRDVEVFSPTLYHGYFLIFSLRLFSFSLYFPSQPARALQFVLHRCWFCEIRRTFMLQILRWFIILEMFLHI